MLTFKQFLFGYFLLDILIIKMGYCGQFLCVDSDNKTFSEARDICQAHNLTLPVLETREEYKDFWIFLEQNIIDNLWLGLQWNQTGGYFEWLNGNILEIQYWALNEPRPQIGQKCVYADNSGYKKWRTASCSIDKYFICFYEGQRYNPYHHPGPTWVNFSTAYEICRKTGGRLPVIVTQTDHNILASTGYFNFWLGLVENDDQFEWITGEKLGFYYWYGNGVGGNVRARRAQPYPYITMESTANSETENFCCQNKTIENGNFSEDVGDLWSQNYFRLVESNAILLESPLSQIMVRRGVECAAACSRDVDCFKYTVDGTTCKTFGNVVYNVSQDDVSPNGVPLHQKVRNW